MENTNQNPQQPVQPVQNYYYTPVPPAPPFPTGKRELIFGSLTAIFCLLLCNFTLFGGFNLGFALATVACMGCTVGYLYTSGHRLNGYSAALLWLCVVIALGFGRSDDGFVKFVMVCFLLLAVNLALCLMAGQNRRNPAGFTSLADPFRAAFMLGLGELSPAFRGLGILFKEGGPAVKKSGAVLVGLAIALPVLCIMIPLLISADAAFSGLVGLLPDFELGELIVTVIFGAGAACVLYTQGTALNHKQKPETTSGGSKKTISHLTVNTVLGAVCAVYVAYLFSQLAYFVGGFSGILPEGFTMAEYARRGFFEMAWLCAIDLSIIAFAVGLVTKQQGKAPLTTRLLCLFVGLVTVFMVATASAKMGMYIGSYGLTRLRVLTEIIMVFLGIATTMVCVWLFVPTLPYMKVILLVALTMGAITMWADVDTVVAAYNVNAYQSGQLPSVDVYYLGTLGDGAVPYLAELTKDNQAWVADSAGKVLSRRRARVNDLRDWNYASWYADQWNK